MPAWRTAHEFHCRSQPAHLLNPIFSCSEPQSGQANFSIGSLLRNTWFLVLALVATGAATLQEPSAVFATLLLGAAFAAVSALLVVRT